MTDETPPVSDRGDEDREAWDRACSEAETRANNKTLPTGGKPKVFFDAGLAHARHERGDDD